MTRDLGLDNCLVAGEGKEAAMTGGALVLGSLVLEAVKTGL
jgi:hypothetical protein